MMMTILMRRMMTIYLCIDDSCGDDADCNKKNVAPEDNGKSWSS